MASRAEQLFCRSLRTILADLPSGANIGESENLRDALNGLEFCLPGFLGSEWHDELDGFSPVLVRKTGEREFELIGLCILFSDQALAPIHLRIQIASNADRISWLECCVGENGKHGMVRPRYETLEGALKRMYEYCYLEGNADEIDWAYTVSCGEKRA